MRQFRAGVAFLVFLAAGAPAGAEQFDLTRAVQSTSLDQGDFTTTYGVEIQRGITTVSKGTGGGGTGDGGGLGGRRDYQGVMHRLAAYYAPLSWFALGVDQSVRQLDYGEFEYGVLYPEARFRLPLLRSVGVETSAFTGTRIRINARRAHTMVVGVGAERRFGRLALLVDVAGETSLATEDRENGLRYEAGASMFLWGPLSAALEFWGTAVWPDNAVFQHSQHAGPTLKVRLRRFWAATNVGVGIKDRPNNTFYEYAVMVVLGFAL